ncbi:uncharacterized protein LOC135843287 isoform X2 [Planococcus citri]|uniref:uncharacterized protein LOC135843287 isoform X2 n=1 Tax=Planococcus citri TaxID=170843 RepID=UPI0031F7F1DA
MDELLNTVKSSNEMLHHCDTLKHLLEELPLPSPPQDEILEILKSNVELFAKFIKQEGQLLINDVPWNRPHNNKNQDESQTKNDEVPHPPRESNSSSSEGSDSSTSDEDRTENDEIPSSKCNSVTENSDKQRRREKPSTALSRLEEIPPAKRRFSKNVRKYLDGRYQRAYGLDPKSLLPFEVIGWYPSKYVVAEHTCCNDSVSRVAFVGNILMLGDGYVSGVCNYITRSYKHKFDHTLYNSHLTIPQLLAAVARFSQLPANVLLSIGNTDALYRYNFIEVRRQYVHLLQILWSLGVRRLHVLPIMTFLGMSVQYHAVASMVSENWSTTFGGDYIFESDLIQSALNSFDEPLRVENDSLVLTPKQWSLISDKIQFYR